MDKLPALMIFELERCPKSDCSIREARGYTGQRVVSSGYFLECTTCNQIWELEPKLSGFKFWDKSGAPHGNIDNWAWAISSKWPKGEDQCDTVGGNYGFKKRMDDAKR